MNKIVANTTKTCHSIDPHLQQIGSIGTRCNICSIHCLLREDQVGKCSAVKNINGQLFNTAYGVIGEMNISPIEQRNVYHYRPGAKMLSLGGIGCNLHCSFCINWDLSYINAGSGGGLAESNFTPQKVVEIAIERNCTGIGWSHNEPTISPMYIRDVAQIAKEKGLYTCLVTNGFMTDELLDFLGPWIDVYRLDAKSWDSNFYLQVAHTSKNKNIFSIAQRAQQEFHIHIEVATNIIPALNDSQEQITHLAENILSHLGEKTPWHLTTFIPFAHMKHVPPTPSATLAQARNIAQRCGLQFVYTDSLVDPASSNTICPSCSNLLIERFPQKVRIAALNTDGACLHCSYTTGIIFSSSIVHEVTT